MPERPLSTLSSHTPQPVEVVSYRFPVGLRARLKHAATNAGRSVNAEVVARLERSLREKP